ncbi:MAG: ParB/RepB/Spo0J family partition protein [Deltaproteobacteria bacterium]|nr:ParB/RepB/Spo0J family partition protein [Deltaproteobacteria bacterium]
MLLQFLPMSALNIADDSFRMTFSRNLDALVSSMKTIGIVQPILVRHTVDGTYQIVTGYRRVLASQKLARQTIPALVYEHTDLSVLQAFLYNLHDNLATRQLSIVEKSNTLHKLAYVYSTAEDELVKRYLPMMGEEPSYKVLHQLLSLHQCSGPMKELVVDHQYALSSAARIAEFSPTTQEALLSVLRPLRATTAKLNELLSMIREISARDAMTVEEVLQRYQLLSVVADPGVAPTAKMAALRQTLRGVRLPTLARRQQQFAGLLQELQLPNMAKITADPYFEDNKLKLECQIRGPEELETIVSHLQKAFERQAWHKIFDWYNSI